MKTKRPHRHQRYRDTSKAELPMNRYQGASEKSRAMKPDDFRTFLERISVPLLELSHDGIPRGISSGCLADYGGCRWVFTVQHSTGNRGKWAIEVGYEAGRGTKLYQIGEMCLMASVNSPSRAFEIL
jgi:hypothetical protein